MKHSNAGYTLVEIVIVLSITAILTSLAVSNFNEQIPHRQLREASLELVGQLRLARQKAISKGADETISFNAGQKQYGTQTLPSHVRFGIASNVTKAPDEDEDLLINGISFAGDSATFRADGTGKLGTIYLTNSKDESVKVTVNITGRVRKYLWNGHGWE